MLARVLDLEAGPARDREFGHADNAAALDPRRRCYLGGRTRPLIGRHPVVFCRPSAVPKAERQPVLTDSLSRQISVRRKRIPLR
jgi:hypothetical protein